MTTFGKWLLFFGLYSVLAITLLLAAQELLSPERELSALGGIVIWVVSGIVAWKAIDWSTKPSPSEQVQRDHRANDQQGDGH